MEISRSISDISVIVSKDIKHYRDKNASFKRLTCKILPTSLLRVMSIQRLAINHVYVSTEIWRTFVLKYTLAICSKNLALSIFFAD
jgi:hypothetical protein